MLAHSQYVFHNQSMTQSVTARLALETQPRQALENGGAVLHDRAMVNIASGKLDGAKIARAIGTDPQAASTRTTNFGCCRC
jgi:hypothetical protein